MALCILAVYASAALLITHNAMPYGSTGLQDLKEHVKTMNLCEFASCVYSRAILAQTARVRRVSTPLLTAGQGGWTSGLAVIAVLCFVP